MMILLVRQSNSTYNLGQIVLENAKKQEIIIVIPTE